MCVDNDKSSRVRCVGVRVAWGFGGEVGEGQRSGFTIVIMAILADTLPFSATVVNTASQPVLLVNGSAVTGVLPEVNHHCPGIL